MNLNQELFSRYISAFREPNLDQALGFYGPNLFAEKPDFAGTLDNYLLG